MDGQGHEGMDEMILCRCDYCGTVFYLAVDDTEEWRKRHVPGTKVGEIANACCQDCYFNTSWADDDEEAPSAEPDED